MTYNGGAAAAASGIKNKDFLSKTKRINQYIFLYLYFYLTLTLSLHGLAFCMYLLIEYIQHTLTICHSNFISD